MHRVGRAVAGVSAALVVLSTPAIALGADEAATEIGTETTRSGADTAVGVVAGVAALAAGSGLVVAARRRKV